MFGLLGKKLGHSFSKTIHEEFTNTQYELIEVEELDQFFNNVQFTGLNVTIPYKEVVIKYIDELSTEAKEIGAVNTIIFKSGKSIGYNTDYIGFHNSIKPFLENTMERALILGTGGASKAIVYALEKIGITCLCVSRSPEENQLNYEELNEFVLKHHLLIVNTTPLGTSPNIDECPDIPYQHITENHLLVDLVYNPAETLFLKKGKEKGKSDRVGCRQPDPSGGSRLRSGGD